MQEIASKEGLETLPETVKGHQVQQGQGLVEDLLQEVLSHPPFKGQKLQIQGVLREQEALNLLPQAGLDHLAMTRKGQAVPPATVKHPAADQGGPVWGLVLLLVFKEWQL